MNLQRTFTTAFGLIAWLEQTQIHLPLKAIECRFEASGAAVNVRSTRFSTNPPGARLMSHIPSRSPRKPRLIGAK
jgi:hypothetical protein